MPGPGVLLLNRFRLERLLGEGGMGSVWSARDEKLDRSVAVKLLRTGDSDETDPEQTRRERARLLGEARAGTKIDHPNVVKVFDVEDEGDAPFLWMELLEGRSLRQHLDEVGQLDVETTCALLVQVARGVAAAHEKNIVHRDLKPANIFLLGTGQVSTHTRVKVLDFGIAKVLQGVGGLGSEDAGREGPPAASPCPPSTVPGNLTREGHLLGSPFYMSPEQVDGRKIDQRTDLWSLGIVLYECLSGVLLTYEEDTVQVFRIIRKESFRPIEEVVPNVPPRIAALLGQLLAKDPAERPDSMEEVIDVLASPAGDGMAPPQVLTPGMSVPLDSLEGLVLAKEDAQSDTGPRSGQEAAQAPPPPSGPVEEPPAMKAQQAPPGSPTPSSPASRELRWRGSALLVPAGLGVLTAALLIGLGPWGGNETDPTSGSTATTARPDTTTAADTTASSDTTTLEDPLTTSDTTTSATSDTTTATSSTVRLVPTIPPTPTPTVQDAGADATPLSDAGVRDGDAGPTTTSDAGPPDGSDGGTGSSGEPAVKLQPTPFLRGGQPKPDGSGDQPSASAAKRK